MSDFSKKLLSLAGIGIILSTSSISSAATEQKQTNSSNTTVAVEGANAALNEVGEWEVMVDTEKKTINTRQLSGKPGIKVAAILGPNSGISLPIVLENYNNTTLVTKNSKTFASNSVKIEISNNTGATLGKPTDAGTTGVRIMLMPYTANECTVATTLQQPICVVTNTSKLLPGTGASGHNDGTDPVYLAYMTPRDGTNFNVPDDLSPVEWNEATGYISPTDYARTIWQPQLTIANGAKASFGMRFRYAQDVPGSSTAANQKPRVTNFKYKFRVLATRTNGKAITSSNAYVTTLAGSETPGTTDGIGSSALFKTPSGVAISPNGTILYVADTANRSIRQIDVSTGNVTTLASTGFVAPTSLAISPNGSTLYVADTLGNRISRIIISTKAVAILAGSVTATPGNLNGTGTAARFNQPTSLAISPNGSTLYVADKNNHSIRKIDVSTANAVVTTLAGSSTSPAVSGNLNGTGTAARFNQPTGVALSSNGSTLYVADSLNHSIRKIDISTTNAVVTTLAGSSTSPPESGNLDGTGTNARFNNPYGVVISPDGKTLYVADQGNKRIRQIDVSTATAPVTTLAELKPGFADGPAATTAQATAPSGVAISPDGTTIYVADSTNNRIRQIQAVEGQL